MRPSVWNIIILVDTRGTCSVAPPKRQRAVVQTLPQSLADAFPENSPVGFLREVDKVGFGEHPQVEIGSFGIDYDRVRRYCRADPRGYSSVSDDIVGVRASPRWRTSVNLRVRFDGGSGSIG